MITLEGQDVTFVADIGQTGTLVFSYTIEDGLGGEDSADVHVELNSPPNVVDDSATVLVNTPVKYEPTTPCGVGDKLSSAPAPPAQVHLYRSGRPQTSVRSLLGAATHAEPARTIRSGRPPR